MKRLIPLILFISFVWGCGISVNTFEKNIAIPQHNWESSFRPEIKFSVTDSSSFYRVFVVVRHSNAYEYNNLWVELSRKSGRDSFPPQKLNLPLANNEKGWLGTGMDDIFEQRILITPNDGMRLNAGEQIFRISHLMRRDPLPFIMNAGIRIEKVGQ